MATESFADKEQRIVRLEEQLAYQSETIEELSVTITRQWEELDKAKRKLDALAERFLALEEATKPPHY